MFYGRVLLFVTLIRAPQPHAANEVSGSVERLEADQFKCGNEAAYFGGDVCRRLGGAEAMGRQSAEHSTPVTSQPPGWRSRTGGKAHPAESREAALGSLRRSDDKRKRREIRRIAPKSPGVVRTAR